MQSTNRQNQIAELRRLLIRAPADAKTLSDALGISQPTFSRLWPNAGSDVLALGAARSTLYGLTRTIRDIGPTLPMFRINAEGAPENFGQITILAGHWYAYQFTGLPGVFTCEGLPYFLQDLRPQGFLGRLAPRENADLNLPTDILEWTDDDALYYLARRGEENMGDLIVGNESYRRFFAPTNPRHGGIIHARDRGIHYPKLADSALKGEIAGSSAGGEQPKVTASILRDRVNQAADHVIVKFSPNISTLSGRRWGDLLIAEHLALATLRSNGIPAAESSILIAGNRVFLESIRFDRIGNAGRASMVSFAGLVGDIGALDKTWSFVATMLTNQKRLSQTDLATIRLLDVYGSLIGNTDRHPGNLSLSWTPDRTFGLRPCYDMLPMMYRPNTQGEVVDREFNLSGLDRLDLRELPRAIELADQFWSSVRADPRISEDFKMVAERHVQVIHPASRLE